MCDDQIGEDFAEAFNASPGHNLIFGPGDAKTWNVGGDADVEDFDV